MELTVGFSPCPNDTFIFDALINGRIDTENFKLKPFFADVQTLNDMVMQQKMDVSKISYGVLPLIAENYRLLHSGGALGTGVGPLLITANKNDAINGLNENAFIALPGKNTTAHLLFSMAYPNHQNKVFMLFHEIEEAVLNGRADAGVIIHENRFTYQQKGLIKIADLGQKWEEKLNVPIPLGGIVMHKKHPVSLMRKVDEWIRKSVESALKNYPEISQFVQSHAQEMDVTIMRKHIELYVNDFSINIGSAGKAAVKKLLDVYTKENAIPAIEMKDILI